MQCNLIKVKHMFLFCCTVIVLIYLSTLIIIKNKQKKKRKSICDLQYFLTTRHLDLFHNILNKKSIVLLQLLFLLYCRSYSRIRTFILIIFSLLAQFWAKCQYVYNMYGCVFVKSLFMRYSKVIVKSTKMFVPFVTVEMKNKIFIFFSILFVE